MFLFLKILSSKMFLFCWQIILLILSIILLILVYFFLIFSTFCSAVVFDYFFQGQERHKEAPELQVADLCSTVENLVNTPSPCSVQCSPEALTLHRRPKGLSVLSRSCLGPVLVLSCPSPVSVSSRSRL